MRGLQVLGQIVAWCSQLVAPRPVLRLAAGVPGGARRQTVRAHRWLRLGVLGCLVSAVVIGIGLSCVSPDPDYCVTRATCPYADTPMGPMQLFCHTTRHVCLLTGPDICVKDEDCGVAAPHCNVDTNACSQCTVGDNTACARFTDRPLCGASADGSGTLCLACRNNLDCPGATPICDHQLCRKCTAHSDCEGDLNCDDGNKCTDSLVCIGEGEVTPELGGSCAKNGASGRVVYVNSFDPVCATTTPTPLEAPYGNQFATPQCTLPFALTVAHNQGRRFIRVVGKDLGPLGTVKDGAAYSFIGAPAKSYPDTATVASRGTLFALEGTGSLTLDQLDMMQINTGETLISCSGSPTDSVPKLTLRRSTLRGSAAADTTVLNQAAVSITNCTTLIDSNIIGVTTLAEVTDPKALAHAKAISIADSRSRGAVTSYLIQNNLIAGNRAVAIDLQGSAGGTPPSLVSRFNTIVGNGKNTPSLNGGVFCAIGAEGQEFSHSIVSGNSTGMTDHSQFSNAGYCGLKDLVVGTGEGLLGNAAFKYLKPSFDAQLRLTADSSNVMCCIDQVSPATGETFPSKDLDGTSRPQGLKWDIGATELKK